LVDVKIADRHCELEIREGVFFVSGGSVVVGWWSLVFNGTRNASVLSCVLGERGAWFQYRYRDLLSDDHQGLDEALGVFREAHIEYMYNYFSPGYCIQSVEEHPFHFTINLYRYNGTTVSAPGMYV